jgi:hypothetical protein
MIRRILVLAFLGLVVAAGTGCPPGRYASCQNDNECPTIDGGKLVCYNLRCVECHYDGDCTNGGTCSPNNTCETLHKPEKEDEPQPPATSLEECAKRCKGNVGCGEGCRDQFKK